MARSSAAGSTYYRVVVNREIHNGTRYSEFFGPYATLGVARSMLNRHQAQPIPEGNWWHRVESSYIEVLTGKWAALVELDASR